MLEAIITGVISGFIVAIPEFFLLRWLGKRLAKRLEKKSFNSAMNQMKESYEKKEKEIQEAGGSLSDCFRSTWEDLIK